VAIGEAVASSISTYLQQQAAAGGVACRVREYSHSKLPNLMLAVRYKWEA
jgi:hypothetical protein